MKTISFLLILLFKLFTLTPSAFSQDNSVILNTPKVFSITYIDKSEKSIFSLSEYTSYNEVYLDTLSKDFLVIERKYIDLKNPLVSRKVEKIPIENIKTLGYIKGNKSIIGSLIGAGSGAIAGFIIASLSINQDGKNNDMSSNPKGVGVISGLVAGAALGYWFGSDLNAYEQYDLSQFSKNNSKKFDEIMKIVRRGMRINKKD
ncbi:MAG: hypothetical protein K1X86_01375 [Ignavibacteria bacterium]|nr:hypothetical protein [Ignavibacteria bacterium]